MNTLSSTEITDQLRALPDWRQEAGALVREYAFADFTLAFAFVVRLALLAEKADHHPDIDIRYNKLRVSLISHDAGGVTSRDMAMARAISQLS